MIDLGDPYEGADPRLAWMLRVLSDEFGTLGVLATQQAAFDYLSSGGSIDNRLGPQSDEPPEESTPEELQCGAWGGCDLPRGHNMGRPDIPENHRGLEQFSYRPTRMDQEAVDKANSVEETPFDLREDWTEVRVKQESDGDMLARLGTDARKWAREFMRLFDGATVVSGSPDDVDESLMVGWFANAISAGEMKNSAALDYLRFLAGPDWRGRAAKWFEQHYGSDASEGANVLDRLEERARKIEDGYIHLRRQFATPPEGWYTLGSHVDHDVPLEFWGADESGTPLWERPVEDRTAPRPVCHRPIGPMTIGSMCDDCGHHAIAHTDGGGPCLACVLDRNGLIPYGLW